MSDKLRTLVSLKTVLARVPYGRTQLWRKWNDPEDDFPRPVECGDNRIAFYEDEISAWIDQRQRRGSPTKAA